MYNDKSIFTVMKGFFSEIECLTLVVYFFIIYLSTTFWKKIFEKIVTVTSSYNVA